MKLSIIVAFLVAPHAAIPTHSTISIARLSWVCDSEAHTLYVLNKYLVDEWKDKFI